MAAVTLKTLGSQRGAPATPRPSRTSQTTVMKANRGRRKRKCSRIRRPLTFIAPPERLRSCLRVAALSPAPEEGSCHLLGSLLPTAVRLREPDAGSQPAASHNAL